MSALSWQLVEDREVLKLHRAGAVARIELHRPEALNALDTRLASELLDALHVVAADEQVRCVVLTGAGRAFCAGADIKGEGDADPAAATREMLGERINPAIALLREMPKPAIAVVNGPAAGVGCSFALACDLVLAASSAYFLLAFSNIGLMADGGATLTVAARVGLGRAAMLAMLAERLSADEALDWGLADKVVADERLDEARDELAQRLAGGPTRSYAALKRALNRALLPGLSEQLKLETRLQAELAASDDYAEGLAAFAERRAPVFKGTTD